MFTAHNISVGESDAGWSLALTDGGNHPTHYLLIQRSRSFDEQDRSLGMDNLHYEIGDQSKSFYGGVNRIRLSPSTLSLWLDMAVARKQGSHHEVTFGLALTLTQWEDLRTSLRKITESIVPLEETGS